MAVVAAVGLASGLVQTLLTALHTQEVKEMCSMFRCESQLVKLEDTMQSINALLHDVDSKRHGLTNKGQVWVEKLKNAVYDIDDLLDEFATIGQQRKQIEDAGLRKMVGNFFSRNNKYFVNFNISREIKKLREKLDEITKDHEDYGYSIDVTKPAVIRPETCSIISELEVIGREGDKKTVLHKLLPDCKKSNFNGRFVCIVGIGGVGKTTLAQLVYNDKKVEEALSPRIWVCVSENFNPKEILDKILKTQSKTESSNLEAAQREVKTLLQGKKYLLVLDDVWNESHERWRDLMPYLISDVSGSKIIITSRSEKVATSIGGKIFLHKLEGLSEENSWCLFKRIAFETESEEKVDHDLVATGKEIVKKCVNVPLCIRVIASFLHDHPKEDWKSFESINLPADMSDAEVKENSIMSTLRFSYYQLTPELKSCFSFCSLFPKDYTIQKDLLISTWLAQGYLVSNKVQSMEDVGEHYFKILLNRCFFQDIELDKHGDVYSFKMHDLMHDLALKVAGKESLFMTAAGEDYLGEKIRHLSMDEHISNLRLSKKLRTYVLLYSHRRISLDKLTTIISKFKRLRVLSLRRHVLGSTLPDRFGKLLHLRYLDLSHNGFKLLPKSITNLHNLQILYLRGCVNLEELPEDMSKLVNLRTLDIHDCIELTYMPRGMNTLTNLQMLTAFVVGGTDWKQTQGSKLADLQVLTSLKGDLRIKLHDFCPQDMPHAPSKSFILKDANLKNLDIVCGSLCCNELNAFLGAEKKFNQSEVHKTLVEDLCPNDDIRIIRMDGYESTKLPSWASMELDMNELQDVKSLSRFRHLKVLELQRMENVEYIEIESGVASASASRDREPTTFFPFLEKLVLEQMLKLKGWWKGLSWREMEGGRGCLEDANGDFHMVPIFPRLHYLTIDRCKSMTYFPPCPHVKRLSLKKVNEALTFCMKGDASSMNESASLHLEKLQIDNARVMNSLLSEFVGGADDIELHRDREMKSIGIVREGFEKLRGGLKRLKIEDCWELDMEDEEREGMPWRYLQSLSSLTLSNILKMVKLPNGLQYLTSLQSLSIVLCYGLEELGDCIGFLTSLQSLKIMHCGNLKALPECIGSLKSLQFLEIDESKLESLPESMRHLTSLTTLDIWQCGDELEERCRQLDGEDWPKICHIPNCRITKRMKFMCT